MVRTAMDGFWIVDHRGRFLEVNDAYCDLVGYRRQELLEMSISDIEAAESPEETATHIGKIIRLGHDRFTTRHRRKDGTILDVEVSVNFLPHEEGLFFVFVRDITHKLRTEEALRSSRDWLRHEVDDRASQNAILRTAIEQLPVSVVMADARGQIEYVNPAFSRITGYSAGEVVGKNPRLLKSGMQGPEFYREMWETLSSGMVWRGEVVNRRKDGGFYTQELVIAPVMDAEGQLSHYVGVGEDVTETRRLRESLELTQFSVDHATDMVLWVDEAGRFSYANESALRSLGYTQREIEALSLWDVATSVQPDRWRETWERSRLAGSVRSEDEVRRKDGSLIPAEVVVTHTRLGARELQCAILRDLSERRARDKRLADAVSFSENLLAAAPVGIITYKATGQCVSANEAAGGIVGTTSAELLKQNFRKLESWKASGLLALAEKAFATGRPQRSDIHILTTFGKEAWLFARCAVFRSEDEEHLLLILADVTERRRAETALRETAHLLLESQRVARVGSYQLDISSGTWEASPTLDVIFGIANSAVRKDVPGWLSLVHPEQREEMAAYFAEEVLGKRLNFDRDYRIVRPVDGEERWVHGLGELIADGEGKLVAMIGTIQDVTERKRAEDEIRRLNAELEDRVESRTAELEASNRELEAFSYSVSHDLRSPLRAIDGFARMLEEDFGERVGEEGRRQIGVVRRSAQRMGQLIDDLLKLSRAGRAGIVRRQIDMGDLVRAVHVEVMQGEDREARVELRVGDLPAAQADPALMHQVWMNLLSNAVKYTRRREDAVVEVTGVREADRLIYLVRDNGVGFDMKNAGKLFGVFERLHSSEEFEGTGVGLALVRRIVNRHGGETWAEGAVGEGATFGFWLPAGEFDL